MSTNSVVSDRFDPASLLGADTELHQLVDSLSGQHGSTDARLARAIWSRVTEPGDAAAGEVIARVGPVTAMSLLMSKASTRSFEHALRDASPEPLSLSAKQLTTAIQRWRLRLDRAATAEDLTTAASHGMRLLIPEDSDWPESLNDLGTHTPHALWVRGDTATLSHAALAVVGARACTGYGSQATADLTGEACAAGFSIVSGAAYGVDAVAHRTALTMGAPTVAVLAGGADRPYPASHDQLIARIIEQGAVCSELVPGSAPTRWRFLQRNRLISALARAILVTEAGTRSGTLNTAGHGAELGRVIGAVPGPITSAASAGCHKLIREYGASLVTNGAEVLELLGTHPESALFGDDFIEQDTGGSADRPPSMHLRILDALPLRGGRALTEVAQRAGVTTQEARDALTELELLRYVEQRVPANNGETLWVLIKRE